MNTLPKNTIASGRANLAALRKSLEHAPELMAKARQEVAAEVAAANAMTKARRLARLTQAQVAERMGTAQPNVSRMLKGRVTLENLFRYLAACGYTAEIRLKPLRNA